MKYVEFCSGIGGTRSGLDAAGWECLFSIDNDPDAIDVHNMVHGNVIDSDVLSIEPNVLPDADVFVAGFPCQPFSSAGNRLGFIHNSGNVFEYLIKLASLRKPPLMIFENVEGLLSNKSGHTFSVILSKLNQLGYVVDWSILNLRWFGYPQTRPRVFIVAAQSGVLTPNVLENRSHSLTGMGYHSVNVFAPILKKLKISWKRRSEGLLKTTEEALRPPIGKRSLTTPQPFGKLGHAEKGHYVSFDIKVPSRQLKVSLASIVSPRFGNPEAIRSARFYARGKPSRLFLREEAVSHCVGSSIGGAPLYATAIHTVNAPSDRNAFLEQANWYREQQEHLVMRLRPDHAVKLFGPYTSSLSSAIAQWPGSQTTKYKLVGNMVAPICAYEVGKVVQESLAT